MRIAVSTASRGASVKMHACSEWGVSRVLKKRMRMHVDVNVIVLVGSLVRLRWSRSSFVHVRVLVLVVTVINVIDVMVFRLCVRNRAMLVRGLVFVLFSGIDPIRLLGPRQMVA